MGGWGESQVDGCLLIAVCPALQLLQQKGGSRGGIERRMRPLHKVFLEVVFAAIKPTFFKKIFATTAFRYLKEKK